MSIIQIITARHVMENAVVLKHDRENQRLYCLCIKKNYKK